MSVPNQSLGYVGWAAETFEVRIGPLISSLSGEILPGVDANLWLETCGPGPTAETRFRLFPGSFFLLWIEAFAGAEASRGAEPLAAAIELLHNATLVHDDVLDSHTIRKGQATMNSRFGRALALLGGDGLYSAALCVMSRVSSERSPGALLRLGQATQDVVAAQILDEPERWAHVPLRERWMYWLAVCRGKLALGNLGGPLAAFWVGQESLEKPVRELLTEYSIVSQVLNDFGDLLGLAGYQVRAPSLRSPGEESRQKPTLPLIWSGCEQLVDLHPMSQLLARAQGEVAERKARALERLRPLPLAEPALSRLQDFFVCPSLPCAGKVPHERCL